MCVCDIARKLVAEVVLLLLIVVMVDIACVGVVNGGYDYDVSSGER